MSRLTTACVPSISSRKSSSSLIHIMCFMWFWFSSMPFQVYLVAYQWFVLKYTTNESRIFAKRVSRSCIKHYKAIENYLPMRALRLSEIYGSLKLKMKLESYFQWNMMKSVITIHVCALQSMKTSRLFSSICARCFLLFIRHVNGLRCNIIFTFYEDINYRKVSWWNEK